MALDLRKMIAGLRADLRRLCAERGHLEMQIVNVHQALSSLAREIDDEREREQVMTEIAAARRKPGLTVRISECLRNMPYADLSAQDVRVWLEREGVDLSDYSQPLSTISITLSRMAEDGRLEAIRKGRNVKYRWNGNYRTDQKHSKNKMNESF